MARSKRYQWDEHPERKDELHDLIWSGVAITAVRDRLVPKWPDLNPVQIYRRAVYEWDLYDAARRRGDVPEASVPVAPAREVPVPAAKPDVETDEPGGDDTGPGNVDATGDDDTTVVRRLGRRAETLQAKVSRLETELRAERSDGALADRIVAAIAESTEAAPVRVAPTPKRGGGRRHISMAVLLGDLHDGMVTTSELTRGLRVFNVHRAECDLWSYRTKVIRLAEDWSRDATIDEIAVIRLGDMLNGGIHGRDGGRNEESETKLARRLSAIEFQFVEPLTGIAPVRIRSVPGNHSRFMEKQASSRPDENWDWVIGEFLRARMAKYLDAGLVEFPEQNGWAAEIVLQGRRFLIQHGDELKGWSSFPYYGVGRQRQARSDEQRILDERTAKLKEHLEAVGVYMLLFGDKHTPHVEPDVFVCNGCLPGVTAFGMKMGKWFPVRPTQVVFRVDRERGFDTAEFIHFEDAPDKHGWVDLPAVDCPSVLMAA